jgi:hypothetical protein
MFSGLFSAICAAIALKLCTWLYIYDLQIKFEDGCYRPIFRRVMPLEGFYSFPDFFSSSELKAQVSYSDRPPSVCKLLHFQLLQNHWANFNQT